MIPMSEILVTCGSIEAIAATLLTSPNLGDEVILPSPSYASYQEVVRMAGCLPRFAALHEEDNFAFDKTHLSVACLLAPARFSIVILIIRRGRFFPRRKPGSW